MNKIFPSLKPNSSGHAKVPKSLSKVSDGDLAQRIASWYYGVELSSRRKSKTELEVIDEIEIKVNGESHTVVALHVLDEYESGLEFESTELLCSHDLIMLEDDRFLDTDGNPSFSGMLSASVSNACPAKGFAIDIKASEIRGRYRSDEALYDEVWQSWNPEANETMFLDLIERFERHEWIGNSNSSMLYIQDLERILKISFEEADRLAHILVHDGKITRDGNTVALGVAKDENNPTRLWATYVDGQNEVFTAKVFLPANYGESQEALIEISKKEKLYDVIHFPLSAPVSANGEPEKPDEKILGQYLSTKAAFWRKPYISPQSLELTKAKGSEPFNPEGTDPNIPSGLLDEFEKSGISFQVFIPNSPNERNEAKIIGRRDADEWCMVVPLNYAPIFGLDASDENRINECVQKMIDEASEKND